MADLNNTFDAIWACADHDRARKLPIVKQWLSMEAEMRTELQLYKSGYFTAEEVVRTLSECLSAWTLRGNELV
jgi:hypothetical protein